jgi:hypothetical protein
MTPHALATYCFAPAEFWITLAKSIFDYQTLIAGILALIAGALAGAPVWKQLRMMRAQNEAGFRKIVADRLQETDDRISLVRGLIITPMNDIGREAEIYHEGHVPDIREEWAFGQEQNVERLRTTLQGWSSSHRDIEPVETAKARLIEHVKGVAEVLYLIHRPDSVSMMQDDREVPDEDYAKWCEESEAAKVKLEPAVSGVNRAFKDLESEYDALRADLNLRLRRIDDRIIGGIT